MSSHGEKYPLFGITLLLFGWQSLNWTVVQDTGYTILSVHALRATVESTYTVWWSGTHTEFGSLARL